MRFGLCLVGSLLVAAAVAASLPVEYDCAATLRVPFASVEGVGVDAGRLLSACAIEVDPSSVAPGFLPGRLWIDAPTRGRLRVHVAAHHSNRGRLFALAVARKFVEEVAHLADLRRITQTDTEKGIADETGGFRRSLQDAQQQLDAAVAALPPSDPRVDRDALMSRWTSLRADLSSSRETLARAMSDLDRLRTQPEPTAGLVSAEERRRAVENDPALQQDLKELTVRLSEIKLHVLTVWQASSGRLDQLRRAAGDMARTLADAQATSQGEPITAAVSDITSNLDRLREVLQAFGDAWTAEFMALNQSEVDPHSGELLEAGERLRKSLNDFLFAAGGRLSSMRAGLTAMGKNAADQARYHVLHSNLTRAFGTLQSAHHKFEFAAAALETPENFRLDAAMRAARGLRRRSLDRSRQIEQRLDAESAERAKRKRDSAIVQAEGAITRTRTASDFAIDEIFVLQEGLLASAHLSQEFTTGALRAELCAQRVHDLQKDLADADARLRQLEAARLALADQLTAEIISCDEVGFDLRWPSRLRVGGVAAAASLLCLMSASWWIQRKTP